MTTETPVDLAALAAAIKLKARALGFERVGIASAAPSAYRAYFRRWLEEGRAGEMGYLGKRVEERVDPGTYFPGAASVICVAKSYYTPMPEQTAGGKVARYAQGDDYHEIIKPRLQDLADWLRAEAPSCRTRCGVDTAPIMEKELAQRAGLGWIGKNTCLIDPATGSWFFLGEVLTTLPLPADEPTGDHCGTCTRCIDACPTQAITAPYQLDARRCISYLTIEHRSEIPDELTAKIGDWLYGCDICQDVCPFNRRPLVSQEPALGPRFPVGLNPMEVQRWTAADFNQALRGSAMKRVKLPMLQRNARIVAANAASGDAQRKAGGR